MNETTYFVANTQETEEGRAQSLFAYDSHEDALEAYHATSSSNFANCTEKGGTLKSFAVALLNVKLYPEQRECWAEPQPTPEPPTDGE